VSRPAAPRGRRAVALLGLGALGAGVAALPVAVRGADGEAARAAETRARGLAAAAAWSDALGAHRAPAQPAPGDVERLVVLLDGAPAAWTEPGRRAAAAGRLAAAQRALEPRIAALGGSVTARWTVVLNGVAVELPAGRADALAALPGVRAVAPVGFLAPAARGAGTPAPAAAAPAPGARPAAGRPAHVALIDTGIDPRAPQLGGGVGATFPVLGGRDLVDGDDDPTVGPDAPRWEGHGTQMAALVVDSPALDGLPPHRVPRLLAYRVVAEERVDGVAVPLARTDRVLSALEAALDPDGDGGTADGAEVVLLGLAGGFAGSGDDPLAQAVRGATLAGALVVVPAGNDGPTFARLGSLGQPAAASAPLTVGGTTGTRAPRTARLRVSVGPAAAVLGPLPLLGPAPPPAAAPLVVLPGAGGIATGTRAEEWDAAAAAGLDVRGAMVVVARGGGTVGERARLAARAGAAGLVVWDRGGTGLFPSGATDGGPEVPVAGAGPAEGAALLDLIARGEAVDGRLEEVPAASAPEAVASFSSTGPTADGRLKPDLVAPAVDVASAWAPATDGTPRTATFTGTSAAAAQAAAVALRLRVDRPDLAPEVVRALLVASARPLPGVRPVAQGAGLLQAPAPRPVVVLPPTVAVAADGTSREARLTLHDIGGRPAEYRVRAVAAGGAARSAPVAVRVPGGGRAAVRLGLPGRRRAWSGRVEVRDRAGTVVVTAPLAAFPPRPARNGEIGPPRVRTAGGVTQAVVRIGRRVRMGDRIWSAPLHDVRLLLVPADASAPLVVGGARGRHDWAPGVYRLVLTRRLPSGGTPPPGVYRLRVSGVTADGRPVARTGAPFRLR